MAGKITLDLADDNDILVSVMQGPFITKIVCGGRQPQFPHTQSLKKSG
ncbi:hypothetical protein [Caminibacter mediatlanticus]|nr:hypothetical protein [Caminibacter mediatlanticus]